MDIVLKVLQHRLIKMEFKF